jgi:AcrR family transcriptional regulator
LKLNELEAGVSPATVYIYYQNKEMMLQDIYIEYSEDVFYYLLNSINNDMTGYQVIETLIQSYYDYIREHEDIFHFVEQFSSCPALSNQCEVMKGICVIYKLFDNLKNKKILKNFRNDNLLAVMFSPVKAISNNRCNSEDERQQMLKEMIKIIQDAVLL